MGTTAPSAAAASPSLTEAPVASPSPSPSLVPSQPPTTWNEVFARDNTQLGGFIVGPDGFIATGCNVEPEDSFCTRSFILSSPDGDTWTLTDLDVSVDFGIRSLHLVGDRLFGLGYGHYAESGGAVVITALDGHTWTRVESPSFTERAIDDIIQTPIGAFATGIEAPIDSDNTSGFLLWPIRADGSFGKPRDIETPDGPPLVSGATWIGEEFIAWGGTQGPYGGPPIILASKDGIDWKVRSTIDDPAPEKIDVADILHAGKRLVAVGNEGRAYPLTPRAWISDDDGRTWTSATVEGSDASMFVVQLEGDRLITRGRVSYGEDQRPVSWESADGSTWTLLPADSDLPDLLGYSPWTRATLNGQVCVADSIYSGETFRGAIYCR